MGRRALLAIVAGVALCSAVALALRFTPLLDERLVMRTGEGVTMADQAKRFHRGAGPCLRYREGAPPSAEVASVAKALFDAGVTSDRATGLLFEALDRAKTQELAAHALSEEDEWLEATRSQLGASGRVLLKLKEPRWRAYYRHISAVSPPAVPLLPPLDGEQRAAVDRAWAAHPTALLLPGMIELLQQLRVLETDRTLDAVWARVLERVSAGQVPESLTELHLEPKLERDAWDGVLELREDAGVLRLVSFGRDGHAGGTDYDADRVREAPLSGADAGVAAPPRSLLPDGPPPAEVTLGRAEVDDVLEHPEKLAAAARVVPAFAGGKAYGFKLFALKAGSVFDHLGLREGDVVRSVNGLPLDSPDHALELYSAVRQAKRLTVQLERGGAPYTVTVRVK